MRYLKKFENIEENQKFDLNFAVSKISGEFNETKVCQMFDEEILEWVDPDWNDGHESENEWYVEHNNGEAQDSVIYQIIDWFKSSYSKDINDVDYSLLFDKIKEKYRCLN